MYARAKEGGNYMPNLEELQEQIDSVDQEMLAAKQEWDETRKEISDRRKELVADFHAENAKLAAGLPGVTVVADPVGGSSNGSAS